jgi:hypothetical protein
MKGQFEAANLVDFARVMVAIIKSKSFVKTLEIFCGGNISPISLQLIECLRPACGR